MSNNNNRLSLEIKKNEKEQIIVIIIESATRDRSFDCMTKDRHNHTHKWSLITQSKQVDLFLLAAIKSRLGRIVLFIVAPQHTQQLNQTIQMGCRFLPFKKSGEHTHTQMKRKSGTSTQSQCMQNAFAHSSGNCDPFCCWSLVTVDDANYHQSWTISFCSGASIHLFFPSIKLRHFRRKNRTAFFGFLSLSFRTLSLHFFRPHFRSSQSISLTHTSNRSFFCFLSHSFLPLSLVWSLDGPFNPKDFGSFLESLFFSLSSKEDHYINGLTELPK